jgi:hypothetical protein
MRGWSSDHVIDMVAAQFKHVKAHVAVAGKATGKLSGNNDSSAA